jgi:hypothetical protein
MRSESLIDPSNLSIIGFEIKAEPGWVKKSARFPAVGLKIFAR